MLLALFLQAAAPETAFDAERAFAAAAQAEGQWTAFRRFAAADAVMFVPEPVNAQGWLKDRKDPPKSVRWWATDSYVACDGSMAVNSGGWTLPDGSGGYFSTIWRREAEGGWKWTLDHGDTLQKPRPVVPILQVRRAACGTKPAEIGVAPCPPADRCGHGRSADGSLVWEWASSPDRRRLSVQLWNGKQFEPVLQDEVRATQ
ncbi:hypothetical protein [Sphingomonas azotifigens]|uniref:hypothetical protein n=1 Tax=Sphingomonas azotifigens TaxID=330920 RepID=UPI000A01280E|nr:hypothetical protein [Sphingomonas azotifigens]